MDWKKLWNDIVNFFESNIWNIILFFAVLVIGGVIVKIIINIIKRMFKHSKLEKITQGFLIAIVRVVLNLILVLILLSIIGIQITGIITALSALLLAVGMALQSNIANVANGIVIVSNHMFHKGDFIEVDGCSGSVTDINFLFTTLTTIDGKKITIPNSIIVNNRVQNNSFGTKRRVDFTFSVAYESDVEKVKEIVINVMKSNGKVHLDPEPFCRLKTLNASSLDFFSNCWCDREDYWDVLYYVTETVYNEFKREGISVPYNQLEIRERKDDVKLPVIGKKLPERVEKERAEQVKELDLEDASFSDVVAAYKRKKKDLKQKRAKKNAQKKAEK